MPARQREGGSKSKGRKRHAGVKTGAGKIASYSLARCAHGPLSKPEAASTPGALPLSHPSRRHKGREDSAVTDSHDDTSRQGRQRTAPPPCPRHQRCGSRIPCTRSQRPHNTCSMQRSRGRA